MTQSLQGFAPSVNGPYEYETVAASQTDQVMGATGAANDYLESVIVSVNTAATGTCSVKDGAGAAIPLTPANSAINCYQFWFGTLSRSGGWSITTGAGATAIGVGKFT